MDITAETKDIMADFMLGIVKDLFLSTVTVEYLTHYLQHV